MLAAKRAGATRIKMLWMIYGRSSSVLSSEAARAEYPIAWTVEETVSYGEMGCHWEKGLRTDASKDEGYTKPRSCLYASVYNGNSSQSEKHDRNDGANLCRDIVP